MATATLAAVGVSTSTSIASGVIVGAAAGAADGAVSGVVNQMGVNLVEGRPVGEGIGHAAWMGAAIGAGVGGLLGGATGAVNRIGRPDFDRPSVAIGAEATGGDKPELVASTFTRGRPGLAHMTSAEVSDGTSLSQATQIYRPANSADVPAVVGHGASDQASLFWHATDRVGEDTALFAQRLRTAASAQGVTVKGIDLISCSGYINGSARALAREFQVPVRAASDILNIRADGTVYMALRYNLRGGSIRTYYPSQLRTSWNYLFGY
jgi:hypothetical protein